MCDAVLPPEDQGRGRVTPVPPGWVLSNIPLSLIHGNPGRGEPLVAAAQTMQVLTASLCRREEEGKGKTIPQHLLGVPSPLTHTVWTRGVSICPGRCQGGIAPGAARPLPRRRARRGRVSVSVCLCVATLSEGRRTTLCGFPASVSPWCLTQDVPCVNSQQRGVPEPGAPGSGCFSSRSPCPERGRGSLGLPAGHTCSRSMSERRHFDFSVTYPTLFMWNSVSLNFLHYVGLGRGYKQ